MTTSEQARADAMADAETLRIGATERCMACAGTGYRGLDDCGDCAGTGEVDQHPVGTDLSIAAWQGERLACLPRLPPGLTEDQVAAAVRIAARAAFRAVPGLRGDK